MINVSIFVLNIHKIALVVFGFVYNGITIIDIVNVARSFMFFNFDAQNLKTKKCLKQ